MQITMRLLYNNEISQKFQNKIYFVEIYLNLNQINTNNLKNGEFGFKNIVLIVNLCA